MKRIIKTTAVIMACAMMAGCNSGAVNETTTAVDATTAQTNQTEPSQTEEVTQAVTQPVEKTEEIDYYDGLKTLTQYVTDEDMMLADTWGINDDTALTAVMKKALAGEDITIAVIGGSITQGTISTGSDDASAPFKTCYADLFFEWWEEMFPDVNVTKINAGIGATGSYLAVNRVKADVLDYNPDLVLVEFAVNDAGTSTSRTTYDNLLRNILGSSSQPAVMCLFMGQTNGSTDQEKEVVIAGNYHLPMVSYINCIKNMMADGRFSAEVLSGDTVHPSAIGHAIIGEILWKYLNNAYHNRDAYGEYEGFDRDKVSPVAKDKYYDGEIIDSEDITPDEMGSFVNAKKFSTFPNDWYSEAGDGGLKFTIKCRNLGVIYYKTVNGKGAKYDVYVDGEMVTTLNSDFSGGWGNYAESAEVFSSDEEAEHVVEFRKSADSEGEQFSVLGLLVSH